MRIIKTITGADVVLDGDLLGVMETLYREVTVRQEFDRTFEDMNREIANLIAQMTDAERSAYLQEALFLNTVTYENQRAAAYVKLLTGTGKEKRARPGKNGARERKRTSRS